MGKVTLYFYEVDIQNKDSSQIKFVRYLQRRIKEFDEQLEKYQRRYRRSKHTPKFAELMNNRNKFIQRYLKRHPEIRNFIAPLYI